MQSRETGLAAAAIGALGRLGSAAAIERLVPLVTHPTPDVAASAIHSLARAAGPAAEPHLVAALQRAPSHAWLAAVEALAEVGTVAAVAPLRTLADSNLLDFNLRRAIARAIAAIQARATGAAPGQLSLADEGDGRLSLPGEDSAGHLSLGEEPGP